MCKTVFIATKEPLTEIPFNEANPDFEVTKITAEFSHIKNKFSNENVYLVNTSRGCGCDFGITKTPDTAGYLEKENPTGKIAEKFRALLGRQEDWKRKHIERVNRQIETKTFYIQQTQKFIALIRNSVTSSADVELYCCWAGDYNSLVEDTKYISVNDKTFFDSFDIELNEKIIVCGQRPAVNSD